MTLPAFSRSRQKNPECSPDSGNDSGHNTLTQQIAECEKGIEAASDRHLVRDADLMSQVAKGDQDAMVVLLERYSAYALRIAYSTLKDRAEAQDIVQETFLKLYQTADRFDSQKGSLLTWLFRLASQAAFDRKEYLRARQFYTVLDIEQAETELPCEYNGSLHLAPQEQEHLLHEVFAMLNPAQRQAIELKLEGYTAEQAAVRSGISSSTSENNLYRGLKKMRDLIVKTGRKAE